VKCIRIKGLIYLIIIPIIISVPFLREQSAKSWYIVFLSNLVY
jgi:hypothetical protein